jgi:CheY-like chemotaxis protein
MEQFSYWLLTGLVACIAAAWWMYQSFARAKGKPRSMTDTHLSGVKFRDGKTADPLSTQTSTSFWHDSGHAEPVVQPDAEHLNPPEEAAEALHAAAAQAAKEQAAALAAQRLALEQAQRQAALDAAAAQAAQEQAARAAQARLDTQRKPNEAAVPPAPKTAKLPHQTVVMIADDSKLVRIKTGRLLAQHDYQVLYALDGQDAILQLQTTVPDLLITDVEMPGLDGFGLTTQVRNNPAIAHLPIVMITAADDKHRQEADRVGVNVLMGKPYSDEALIHHIRTLVHPTETLSSVA